MKIKNLLLSIFVASIVINSAIIIFFVSSKMNEIGAVTSQTGSKTLIESADKNLLDIATGIKVSLDSQLNHQYMMVKSWAQLPVFLDTAKSAQKMSKESLYEMWSAASTRKYDEGEAVGDGNPDNDLSPSASNYLAELSKTMMVYPEIFITDNRGYAVAASVATGDFDQGPDDWRVFQDATGTPYFKKNKPEEGGEAWYKKTNESPDGFYISAASFDESTKTWGLELISQIKEQKTGAYLGQLKAVFDFSGFISDLVNLKDLDIDLVRVIMPDGSIIASYDKNGAKVTTTGALEKVGGDFLKEIEKNKKSGVLSEEVGGMKSKTIYQASGDQNKYVIAVSKSESKISQPIVGFVGELESNVIKRGDELKSYILMIALIVGILIMIIAYLLINMQILNPIKRLSEVADKLSDGDFSVEMPIIKTGNEIEKFSSLTALLVSTIKQLKK